MKTQRQRRREELALYKVNRERRLVRARGRCEFGTEDDGVYWSCKRAATETHHVEKRKMGGRGVNHDVEWLRALCSTCHALIHAHEKWAEENGWLVRVYSQIGRRGDADPADG